MSSFWRRVVAVLVALISALLLAQVILGGTILKERERLSAAVQLGHWQAVEAESELLRFWRAAAVYRVDPNYSRVDDLVFRFDVLWSRIDLLLHSDEAEEIRHLPDADAMLDEIKRHMTALDLAVQSAQRGNPAPLNEQFWRLRQIEVPLQDFVQTLVSRRREQYGAGEMLARLDQLFYLSIGLTVLAVLISVTVWRLTERSQRTERLLETAIESVPDGFLLLDENERVVLANSTYRNLYDSKKPVKPGMSFREAVKNMIHVVNIADVISFDASDWDEERRRDELIEWRLSQLRNGGGVWEQRLRDGRVLQVKETALKDGGYVSLRSDITRLKQVEDQLRRQIQAMDMTDDAIGISDSAGNITYMNEAYARLLGCDGPEALIGHSWTMLYDEHELQRFRKEIMPNLMSFGSWRGEAVLQRPDGGTLDHELTLTQLPDGGVIGVIRDITARKRAEEERRQLQQQVYQAQKMEAVGRLAGGIAHDFNNILASMIGYAGMLASDLPPESEQHMFAENIRISGERASELVSQILAFSRTKETMNLTSLPVEEVVDEISQMIRATLPTTIELSIETEADLPTVRSSRSQFNQMLMNLCVNARDAMAGEQGRLVISASRVVPAQSAFAGRFADPEGDGSSLAIRHEGPRSYLAAGRIDPHVAYVCISVTDNGTGIPPDVLEHVLEPFYTTKDVNKGTGLGLSAVHGIVLSSNGGLLIETEAGKGSRFSILLPAEAADAIAEAAEDRTSFERGTGTIVVVDDDINLAPFLERLLDRLGYMVTVFNSGAEAVEYLIAERDAGRQVDLLLSDQTMPGMTGVELVRLARGIMPGMKIILSTGYSEQVNAGVAQEAGADLFIEKPVEPEALSHVVARLIGSGREASAIKGASARERRMA